MNSDCFIHPSAEVSAQAQIGPRTKIWHQAQVREGAVIGSDCILGKDVYIDQGVQIGDRVKIQNSVSVYRGVTIEDDVFVGPQASFTNDLYPRADNAAWQVVPTQIRRGASIGANATIVCGVTVGERAMVGAGAVVTRDVPPDTLVVGNPARVLRRLSQGQPEGPLAVMLVGLGRMGRNHARILASLPEQFDLRLIADQDDDQLAWARQRHPGARLVTDYREGLSQVQAVVVATPPSTHQAIAAEVLSAGRHCLLEKPCTLSAATAAGLFSLAAEQNVLLQAGHSERYNPAVAALLQSVQGERLVAVSAERVGPAAGPQPTDVIFDLAVHDLEVLQALIDRPATRVQGHGLLRAGNWEYASALIDFAGRLPATITVSRLTPWRRRTITVTTEQAVYVADCLRSTLTRSQADQTGSGLPERCQVSQHWQFTGSDALTRQALDFARAIRSGDAPLVGSRTVLPALQIAEAVISQLEATP